MNTVIYWFRNDLRLTDNPALLHAIAQAEQLIPVYCHDSRNDDLTRWGFARMGAGRRCFLRGALDDLRASIAERGSELFELHGEPHTVVAELARRMDAAVVAEAIEAPEEQAAIKALEAVGIRVSTVWQSSMIDPQDMPIDMRAMPDVFTAFRKIVENADLRAAMPVDAPATLPPLPGGLEDIARRAGPVSLDSSQGQDDARSAFPYARPEFHGGENAALTHLHNYLDRKLASTYKDTRNDLIGTAYSGKFSPWLASGALSARTIYAALRAYEGVHGANESTYWLWFELLWRDFFRFQHLKHGRALYRARGFARGESPVHNAGGFERWCAGRTGNAFIDAGMRELAATSFLSNRMRQNVASFLVYDLHSDWRAGAAWFESQLLDYDVYSNQGNWLSIAGIAPNPRGPRRFDPEKQAHDYDASGAYRKLWAA